MMHRHHPLNCSMPASLFFCWWFVSWFCLVLLLIDLFSLLVHSGVSSATRRKATGADHKKWNGVSRNPQNFSMKVAFCELYFLGIFHVRTVVNRFESWTWTKLTVCPGSALRRPDGSVGRALVLPALTDCRWWFESLLIHSGVSSATRRKATGADHKKNCPGGTLSDGKLSSTGTSYTLIASRPGPTACNCAPPLNY